MLYVVRSSSDRKVVAPDNRSTRVKKAHPLLYSLWRRSGSCFGQIGGGESGQRSSDDERHLQAPVADRQGKPSGERRPVPSVLKMRTVASAGGPGERTRGCQLWALQGRKADSGGVYQRNETTRATALSGMPAVCS